MIKRILILLCFVLLLNNYVFALPYVQHTIFEFHENDSYEYGFQRLARTITKTKGIPCKVIAVKYATNKNDSEKQLSKASVILQSDTKWVNGTWIVDLVPYNAKNMSIKTAKETNNDYQWWFVYYNDKGQPEAVVWARYGK